MNIEGCLLYTSDAADDDEDDEDDRKRLRGRGLVVLVLARDEHVVAGQRRRAEGQPRRRGEEICCVVRRIRLGVLTEAHAPSMFIARLRAFTACVEIKLYGSFARWRGDAGSLSSNGASAAT